jgi:hypothetical protein
MNLPLKRDLGRLWSRLAFAAFWLVLLIFFVVLRLPGSDALLNIDETIPLKVSEAMRATGALDPNWRLADLPDYFRYDQYNFYLYNILAHYVVEAARWFELRDLNALRIANIPLQALALAFTVDALRRLKIGAAGIAIAAVLVAVAPGMVQDAGMARPESLIYLLVALSIWVLTLPLRARWRLGLFGFVLGAGMAIKLSFATTVVLAAPLALEWRNRSRGENATCGALLVVGAIAGFALAAPYALIHFDVYLNGLAALRDQYNRGHPPHSLLEFTIPRQAAWIGLYFVELYSVAPVAALAAVWLYRERVQGFAIAFAAAWIVLFLYFVTKPVFFERNFSHALIPLLAGAALGTIRLPRWRTAVAAIMIVPMAYWSVQILLSTWDDRRARFETEKGLAPSQRIGFGDIFGGKVPESCLVIGVVDFHDGWTWNYLTAMRRGNYREIALYRGRFHWLTTSTLQTYLDADMHYFLYPR